MSELIIEIECGETLCLSCDLTDMESGTMRCRIYGAWLSMVATSDMKATSFYRCPACLAAEEKLNAIERRYAELVETTAARTDQAKREK